MSFCGRAGQPHSSFLQAPRALPGQGGDAFHPLSPTLPCWVPIPPPRGSASPLWLWGHAQASEDRCEVNFPLLPPPAFFPLPPLSPHTPKDSLEAEVTQGFQN